MLPKIQQPLFDITIPSTGETVLYRPYLVKEEKLLLIAQQSDNEMDILRAMRQVVNNCIQKDNFEREDLTTFDLEYLFLKLRAKSVDNKVKVAYRDNEDDKVYEFEIDLDDIEVTFPENVDKKIKINDEVGMVMKYPSSKITDEMKEFDNEIELMMFFISKCIDSIYDTDNVYPSAEFDEKELNDFINSLDVQTFDKVRIFFENMPKLYHKIEYENSLGSKKEIELKNIKDFFTLR